jgi:hypothetical protein
LIGPEDAPYTYEYPNYYKILPAIHNWSEDPGRIGNGIKVDQAFTYSSNNNSEWMQVEELKKWIKKNKNKIGNI